jgi:hypothetical protein
MKLHPPYHLFSTDTGMEMTAYLAPKPNRMHYPFTEEWQWDAAIDGWQSSKVTVKVQEETIENCPIWTLVYSTRGYFGTDAFENELKVGIDITSLADRLEFYEAFTEKTALEISVEENINRDVLGYKVDPFKKLGWFVRLLPEKPSTTAICPTCGHPREVSIDKHGSGCFVPEKVKEEESWDDVLTNMIVSVGYCITNYDGAKKYFEENYLPPKKSSNESV